jgi:streptomycin 6-kinase
VLHRLGGAGTPGSPGSPGFPGSPGSRDDVVDGWVAIDPKPMAGHPGYELMPALRNRTDEYGTGSAVRHLVRRRLEIVCEAAGIDVEAAKAWTSIAGLLDIYWHVTSGDEASASLAVAVLKALGD